MASAAERWRRAKNDDDQLSNEDSDSGGLSSAEESGIDRELMGFVFESSDEEEITDDDEDSDGGSKKGGKVHGHSGNCGRGGSSHGRRGRRADSNAPGGSFKSYDHPDVGNVLPPFAPTRPPGLHLPTGNRVFTDTMTTALQFFHLFFSVEMINTICTHTNTYARSSDGSWSETNPEEISQLIAILVYFGVVSLNSVDRYWSTQTLYNGLWAQAIMTEERFYALLAMLHVADPLTKDKGGMLHKVESFVNHFKDKCTSLYQPYQNVSVDERMAQYRYRPDFHEYIRDKPTKYGMKLWVLGDSANGYVCNFDIYKGKDAGRNVKEHGLGYDVVMKLMHPFLHQGYHLFFDNFYTSVQLVSDLFGLGVPATGILSEHSKFPACLKNSNHWAKNKRKGSMRWERISPCLALQWKDKKVVSLLTTIDNANESVLVTRKEKSTYRKVSVPQPNAIKRYNTNVYCAGLSDQILVTNLLGKMKWWKTLFFHLVDIAIVNSFILFREHGANNPDIEALQRPKPYTLVDFREELMRQLTGFAGDADADVEPAHESAMAHMPAFSEDARRECVVCYKQGRGKLKVSSFLSAPQCGVYMHITKERNCFLEYHSAEYWQ